MLKPGYKQTDLGALPQEWEVRTLGEVLEGVRLGGNYANTLAPTAFPLIKMANLNRSVISLAKLEFIRPEIVPESKHRLKFGDLLFNTRNTLDLVGKVAIWRDELPTAFYNSNILRLDFDPRQIASSFFVNYIINTEQAITQMRGLATGTTSVAAVYTRDLLTFQIPVPPLAEQRAIADTLGAVDALLHGQRALLAKKRGLQQATQQALLTRARRLPGFGGEWEERTLGECLQRVIGGGTPSRSTTRFWDGPIPWVTVKDLSSFNPYKAQETITRLGLENSASHLIPKGTLIICTRMAPGRAVIYAVDVAINQDLKALFVNATIDPLFLYYWLQREEENIAASATGSTVKGIQVGSLKALSILVPPPAEQQAIAAVLTALDAELAALAAELAKTEALKQGLMQDLLTGAIRLRG